jgi:hypothetical protein
MPMRSQRERSCKVPFCREGGRAGNCRSLNHSVQGFEARKPPMAIAFLTPAWGSDEWAKEDGPVAGQT